MQERRSAAPTWRRADGLIVNIGLKIDKGVIDHLEGCKIIVRAGVGFDHIDIAYAASRGIPVCNVPNYGTTEVADHAVALVINTARGGLIDIPALEAALREGRIDGAGIDVLPGEPPDPNQALIQAFRRRELWIDGRLLLTPHAAWYSPDGHADMRRKEAATVADFLTKGVRRNVVNGVSS